MSLTVNAIKCYGSADINSLCEEHTAGGTFAAFDIVKFSGGKLVVAATSDAAAAVAGMAMTAGSSDAHCVLLPKSDAWSVVKRTDGTEAVTNVGVVYDMGGSTGAFTVNLAATSNPMLTVRTIDIANALAEVQIL